MEDPLENKNKAHANALNAAEVILEFYIQNPIRLSEINKKYMREICEEAYFNINGTTDRTRYDNIIRKINNMCENQETMIKHELKYAISKLI